MMEQQQMQWMAIAEVTKVFNRYFRALDEKNLEVSHLQLIFTPDAKVIRPNGAALVGPQMIGTSHQESLARFRGTQHLLTNHDVTIDGENAAVRANLVALHFWASSQVEIKSPEDYFLAGGVITAQLRHASEGWRISHVENQIVWRTGSGFERMLRTGT
jgi:hypothetical protein